ncbi:MAG: helix-turn-helix domain-containing protein [Verrucomicrobia bacterium]|nr:helix-turn-helix domain-containing protein [Verrucomicrobiota bacterium]
MVTDKIKELEATKARVTKLEQSIAAQLTKELAALPGQYGFDSVEAFCKAVKAAAGKRRGSAPKKAKAAGKKRRKRAVITDATRAEVKKLVEAGKTGGEIAAAVGISLPSVQNIKKALGLVGKK